ncbi:hypothetical protein BC629DRAFT_1471769 [Irpex lacteus]|nr:hypothetical protein BC629DRAFT_1471769 [Irpex lacteus]
MLLALLLFAVLAASFLDPTIQSRAVHIPSHALIVDYLGSWAAKYKDSMLRWPHRQELSLPPNPTSQPLSASIQAIVDDLLDKRLAVEKVLQSNFAARSRGASVACTFTSGCSSPILPWDWVWLPAHAPQFALMEEDGPGEFWRIDSRNGQLGIFLSKEVAPLYITLQHIRVGSPTGPTDAPRNVLVWGAVDGDSNLQAFQSALGGKEGVRELYGRTAPGFAPSEYQFAVLASFEYDISGPVFQTFPIAEGIQLANLNFRIVVVEVIDNWGSSTTRLDRVLIHGNRAFY